MRFNIDSLSALVTSSKAPDWEGSLCYKPPVSSSLLALQPVFKERYFKLIGNLLFCLREKVETKSRQSKNIYLDSEKNCQKEIIYLKKWIKFVLWIRMARLRVSLWWSRSRWWGRRWQPPPSPASSSCSPAWPRIRSGLTNQGPVFSHVICLDQSEPGGGEQARVRGREWARPHPVDRGEDCWVMMMMMIWWWFDDDDDDDDDDLKRKG